MTVVDCPGFPIIIHFVHQHTAVCSIGHLASWHAHNLSEQITPQLMAELVDRHKAECTNREVSRA